VFAYLDEPAHLNIENLTAAAKELVISKYQNHAYSELKNIYTRIKNSTGSDGKQFVDYMKTLDRHRNQSFLDSHYEIAIAMGYTV
jgi:Zn-dependent M28 family amino/carboxypeptidase